MSIENRLGTPLAAAVRKAGSQSAFGRIIKRRQSTVRGWLVEDKPLPAEDVLTLERELGISRHFLRPDIYPVEHGAPPVAQSSLSCDGNGETIADQRDAGTASQAGTVEARLA